MSLKILETFCEGKLSVSHAFKILWNRFVQPSGFQVFNILWNLFNALLILNKDLQRLLESYFCDVHPRAVLFWQYSGFHVCSETISLIILLGETFDIGSPGSFLFPPNIAQTLKSSFLSLSLSSYIFHRQAEEDNWYFQHLPGNLHIQIVERVFLVF